MNLLRDPHGRLRTPWRLGIFLLLATALLLVLGWLASLTPLFGLADPAEGAAEAGGYLFTLTSWLLLAAALLLASWLVMEKVEDAPLAALGLPVDAATAGELGRGFALGGGVILAGVALLAVPGWVEWGASPEGFRPLALAANVGMTTVLLAVAALAEELLFRGYVFQAVAERGGGVLAVGLTALLFGLAHGRNPGAGAVEVPGVGLPLPLVNITLAGVLLGLAYWRTYSLWFATGVHLGWNWMMGVGSDLTVSGLEPGTPGLGFFDTPGYDASVVGPELWTGGSFGPEGGLAVTVVTLAAVAWVARTEKLQRSLRVRALGALPDRGREEVDA